MTAARARQYPVPAPALVDLPQAEVSPVPEAPAVTDVPAATVVRRFSQNDFQSTAHWLVPKLQRIWGGASQQRILSFLRQWQQDNGFNFACTDHAVALAQLVHDQLDPKPRVEEIFTIVQPGYEEEGIAIYKHFKRWMKMTGAFEFRFAALDNAPVAALKDVFPDLRVRKAYYTRVE